MILPVFFDRPSSTGTTGEAEKAVLVHVDFDQHKDSEQIEEFRELVKTTGAQIVAQIHARRTRPDAKYFVGSGKADEIKVAVQVHQADIVLLNHAISPAQERNLENLLQCRVQDRTAVILDIFAQRARSHEGKLQVELAQLNHMSTRLIRGWTHLERQKGGIGLRGPGETQLETDRRLLGIRIKQLQKRLNKVKSQRQQNRQARKRARIINVSLVGYTNAGKSTLFNCLAGADVYVRDQLFATLDPTLRRVQLPKNQAMILADTVGFIRHLPHDLINAFHATLQETQEADLLLHVIDAHAPGRDDNIQQVDTVIKQVGAQNIPQIQVFNKIDLLTRTQGKDFDPRLDRNVDGKVQRVWLSAANGDGIDLLKQAISEFVIGQSRPKTIDLPPHCGKIRALLYTYTDITSEHVDQNGHSRITFECSAEQYKELLKHPELKTRLKKT